MTRQHNCKHQECPTKWHCGYPLRQSEAGQPMDAHPEPLAELSDPWRDMLIALAVAMALVVGCAVVGFALGYFGVL